MLLPNPTRLMSPIHTIPNSESLTFFSFFFSFQYVFKLHSYPQRIRELDCMRLGKYKSEARRDREKERLIEKFGDNARFNTGTGILSGTNTVHLFQRPERPSSSDNLRAYNTTESGHKSSASKSFSSLDGVQIKLEEDTMNRQVRS